MKLPIPAIPLVSTLLGLSCLAGSPAIAEYVLPDAKVRMAVLAGPIQLKREQDRNLVTTVRGQKSYTWDIPRMWLADRIDSDSICTGRSREVAEKYLSTMAKVPRTAPFVLELVDTRGDGSYFVANLYSLQDKYEQAKKAGIPELNMTPEAVSAFKDYEDFFQAVRQVSDANWKKVESVGTK